MCFGYRCASECKPFGIRQDSLQFHLIVTIFRTVCFVNQHNHVSSVINNTSQFVEFLNGSDKDTSGFVLNDRFQVSYTHHLTGIRENTVQERIAHLVFQVLTVNHYENSRVVQLFSLTQFVSRIEHGERLS